GRRARSPRTLPCRVVEMSDQHEMSRRMIIIIGGAGEIVAVAGAEEDYRPVLGRDPNEMVTGPGLLPGQSIHVVEMPEEFFRERAAGGKHRWRSEHGGNAQRVPPICPGLVRQRLEGSASESASA